MIIEKIFIKIDNYQIYIISNLLPKFGGKSVWNSLALPGTVKSERRPVKVLC